MADVFPITGILLPPTPPYRLSGDLVRAGEIWRFTDFDGRLGDSDLRGEIEVDLAQDALFFDADLVTGKLDFDDLAARLRARKVLAPNLPIDDLDAELILEDDVSLLNLGAKVHVEGTFVEPAISLDAGSILKFVPLVDLGLAEDAPCKNLIARAREDGS